MERRKRKKVIFLSSIAVSAVAAIILVIAIVVSIDKANRSYKAGDWIAGYFNSMYIPNDLCAIKADNTEFDIDDVRITLCFGYYHKMTEGDQSCLNIPEFDVFFSDENKEMISLIRHSDENYISEEYTYSLKKTKQDIYKVNYNHSEKVKIPRELFDKEEGDIYIRIAGNELNVHKKYFYITGVRLKYQ